MVLAICRLRPADARSSRCRAASIAAQPPRIPTAPYAAVTMTAELVRTARAAAERHEPATAGYGQLQANAAFGS